MRDAGYGRDRFVETAIEAVELIGRDACGLRIELDDSAVCGIKAEVLMFKPAEAEDEEPRSADQNNGDCSLRNV